MGFTPVPDQKIGQNICNYGLFSGPWLSGSEGQTLTDGKQCSEPTSVQLPAWVEFPGCSTGRKNPGGAPQTEVSQICKAKTQRGERTLEIAEAPSAWQQRTDQHICVRRAPEALKGTSWKDWRHQYSPRAGNSAWSHQPDWKTSQVTEHWARNQKVRVSVMGIISHRITVALGPSQHISKARTKGIKLFASNITASQNKFQEH